MYRSDKRLYLTRDRSRAVEEGDPEAAFLLVVAGGEMPDDEAKRLGLTGKKQAAPEPEPVPSTAADREPPAEEQPAGPPAEERPVEETVAPASETERRAARGR